MYLSSSRLGSPLTATPRHVTKGSNYRYVGPVAQLGARMTGSHEVEGSNPSRSTITASGKVT